MRPGEKLFEELGFNAERMDRTAHPKIYIGKLAPSTLEEAEKTLEFLTPYTESSSTEDVHLALQTVLPEMLVPEIKAGFSAAVASGNVNRQHSFIRNSDLAGAPKEHEALHAPAR